MVKQIKKLRITHIDNGTQVCHPSNMEDGNYVVTGAWPKVSFSDGKTFSYMWLTNTKVILFTANAKYAIINADYSFLINEFFDSNKPFRESNWLAQHREEWPVDVLEDHLILA